MNFKKHAVLVSHVGKSCYVDAFHISSIVSWKVTQPGSMVCQTHAFKQQFGTRFYVQTLLQKYFAKIAQAASTAYMLLLDATHFTMVSAWAPWLTKMVAVSGKYAGPSFRALLYGWESGPGRGGPMSLGTPRSVISIAFQVFICFPVCLRKKHRASDMGDRDITPKSKQNAYEQVSQ